MPVIFRVACIQLMLSAGLAVAWALAAGLRGALLALAGGSVAALLSLSSGTRFVGRVLRQPGRPLAALFGARAFVWLATVLLLLGALGLHGAQALPFVAGLVLAHLGFLLALLWE